MRTVQVKPQLVHSVGELCGGLNIAMVVIDIESSDALPPSYHTFKPTTETCLRREAVILFWSGGYLRYLNIVPSPSSFEPVLEGVSSS